MDDINRPPLSPAAWQVDSAASVAKDHGKSPIAAAPDPVAGHLHGTALKYLLRLWHKDNAAQDAGKAAWYLQRLSHHLNR